VLYLPLGLALRAREELPKLAAEGRERFANQAPLARMVGQMAVAQGRRKVDGLLDRKSEPPLPVPAEPGVAVPIRDLAVEEAGGADAAGAAPEAWGLTITGYVSLSASQVFQRLPRLSPSVSDAVTDHDRK